MRPPCFKVAKLEVLCSYFLALQIVFMREFHLPLKKALSNGLSLLWSNVAPTSQHCHLYSLLFNRPYSAL